MNSTRTETIIDAMKASFAASLRTPDGVVAPVALLWTDADGQWKPLLPALQKALPQLFLLGRYEPDKRQGPVIWLKCVVDRTLPNGVLDESIVPILYLPNVRRQDLRAAGDCDPVLKPLVELQYRGKVWHQRNGNDWTVEAFLTSDDALGLRVVRNNLTRDAMLRALPLLAQEPNADLRGRWLSAADFDRLAIGDPVRDLLIWMSDRDYFERKCSTERWNIFRNVCVREFDFDPDTHDTRTAAGALVEGRGRWDEIWERYCESPEKYPGIPRVLRTAHPNDLLFFGNQSRRPDINENREKTVKKQLKMITEMGHVDACDKVVALDEEHQERRGWVWSRLGESPFALALEPLGRLARSARHSLGGANVESLISGYVAEGWRCDRAALDALSILNPGAEHNVVAMVVRALYKPWLDRSARSFQEFLAANDADLRKLVTGVEAESETCVLFTDGLRFDLGVQLWEKLVSCGIKAKLSYRVAPFPTVTASAKPLASPAHFFCEGGEDAEDFYPLIAENGKQADAARLRDAMVRRGVEVLMDGETPMAVDSEGGAWTEIGKIDKLGHSFGAALADHIEPEIEVIVNRVNDLLGAGWQKVRIVTDHGWLLLPGGLPRIELSTYLVETRWARCATVRGESAPAIPTYPWYWNPMLRIASPPGIGAFRASMEYAHGGVSLQECIVPDLIVERGQVEVSAKISEITWRGMRCRVSAETTASGISVDLRLNRKQSESSIVAISKELTETGEASLAVPDDSHEGAAVTVVLIDQSGTVLDYQATTVGEEE